jgi:hypothetical protein
VFEKIKRWRKGAKHCGVARMRNDRDRNFLTRAFKQDKARQARIALYTERAEKGLGLFDLSKFMTQGDGQ